jgi:hypothetical protein
MGRYALAGIVARIMGAGHGAPKISLPCVKSKLVADTETIAVNLTALTRAAGESAGGRQKSQLIRRKHMDIVPVSFHSQIVKRLPVT